MRRPLFAAFLLAACSAVPEEPCGSMTPGECGRASHFEIDGELRGHQAQVSCEAGSAEGCSTLGLHLLLGSADAPERRHAAYRAFRMACYRSPAMLCLQPMFLELHKPSRHPDFIINGFDSYCDNRESEWCYLIPPIKQRLGLPVTDLELSTARALAESTPFFDMDQELSPESQFAVRPQLLMELPANTNGNLWAYGRVEEPLLPR